MEKLTWIATAAFGMEGLVAHELRNMGFETASENGAVRFDADVSGGMRANLWLRTADRVLLLVGEFKAVSFEELFEKAHTLPWERWISRQNRFPVTGNCARSQLMSVRDCQSILKKAIVERLKARYRLGWLPEDGPSVSISFQIHADHVRLCLNSSGPALSRRGYRTWNGEAPLRETLAAALVSLSPWRPGRPLVDPMCGTGTLVIEAAMQMSARAPGLCRSFDLESWPIADARGFSLLRQQANERFSPEDVHGIEGSDVDPQAVDLAQRHLAAAGLSGKVRFRTADVKDLQRPEPSGCFLTNPPYGERLSDRKTCEALYRTLGQAVFRHEGWSFSAITSHPGFERCFGRKADRKRRFYNGRIECEFMTFDPGRQKRPAAF